MNPELLQFKMRRLNYGAATELIHTLHIHVVGKPDLNWCDFYMKQK